MKNIKLLISIIIVSTMSCSSVFATANFTSSAPEVYSGSSFDVTLEIDPVAAWNVRVESLGPVEDCSLVDANVTDDARNTTKTFSITCIATESGDATITLSGDYTNEDGITETLSNQLRVHIIEPSSINDTTIPTDNTTMSEDDSQEEIIDDSNIPNTGQNTKPDNVADAVIGWVSAITAATMLTAGISYFLIRKILKAN